MKLVQPVELARGLLNNAQITRNEIQEAACGLFQEAVKSMKSRRAFWERMRSFFTLYILRSWQDLFEAMKQRLRFKGSLLIPDTS